MKTPDQDERSLLLAYIGDRLSPGDRESFERRLLEEETFSQKIEEAEFALLEEFSDGSLPHDEHTTVAAWVAGSPPYRTHVAVTAALRGAAIARPATRSVVRLLAWPLSVAACLACMVTVLLLHHRYSMPEHTIQVAQAPMPPVASLPQHRDTILLDAQRLRGSAVARFLATYTVHPGFPTRLQIIVPRGATGNPYSLDLHLSGVPSGSHAIHAAGLHAHTESSVPYVEFIMPPSSLMQGRYMGELRSQSESYDLGFSVIVAK